MMDDMMRYDPGRGIDYTSAVTSHCSELDALANEALNKLAGVAEFFDTQHGSISHAQAQQMIMDAVNDGKETMIRQAAAVDTSFSDFAGQDVSAGSKFSGI